MCILFIFREQDVRAAPHGEQVGMGSDDQHDRDGAKGDAGFECAPPELPPAGFGAGAAASSRNDFRCQSAGSLPRVRSSRTDIVT